MDGSFPRGLKRWRVTDRGEGLIHSFSKEAGPRLLGPVHCVTIPLIIVLSITFIQNLLKIKYTYLYTLKNMYIFK